MYQILFLVSFLDQNCMNMLRSTKIYFEHSLKIKIKCIEFLHFNSGWVFCVESPHSSTTAATCYCFFGTTWRWGFPVSRNITLKINEPVIGLYFLILFFYTVDLVLYHWTQIILQLIQFVRGHLMNTKLVFYIST